MKSLQKLAKAVQKKKLDGFLILKPENIRYLTGFKGSFGMVLVSVKGPNYLITDSRYQEQAEQLCENSDELECLLFDKDFADKFGKTIKGKFGTENTVTLRRYDQIKKWFPEAKWRAVDGIVESMRVCKAKEEIEYTRKAAEHTSAILHKFLPIFFQDKGISEEEAAFMLESMLRDGGNYELAFPAIIAFGENSSIPHHQPSHRTLIRNENILIDCGAKYKGYCADITRNFWFGSEVDPEYRDHFDQLLSVQKKILKKFVIGSKAASLHQEVVDSLGPDSEYFTHSLGHGTGLEIHEAPSISDASQEVLEENQIVTCEPGIYYPKKFGIRIEDQLIVKKRFTKNNILSPFESDLLVLMFEKKE